MSARVDRGDPPPRTLYHGTPRSNLAAIWRIGLLPLRYPEIYMHERPDMAALLGSRHDGSVVVLRVRALMLHKNGWFFGYVGHCEWLTKNSVPPWYLSGPGMRSMRAALERK